MWMGNTSSDSDMALDVVKYQYSHETSKKTGWDERNK